MSIQFQTRFFTMIVLMTWLQHDPGRALIVLTILNINNAKANQQHLPPMYEIVAWFETTTSSTFNPNGTLKLVYRHSWIRLKKAKEHSHGPYLLQQQLKKRVWWPPSSFFRCTISRRYAYLEILPLYLLLFRLDSSRQFRGNTYKTYQEQILNFLDVRRKDIKVDVPKPPP